MHLIWLDCIYIHFSDSLYLVQSSPKEDLTLGSRLQQDLKNDLIAGLLVVIPLATTIWPVSYTHLTLPTIYSV